MENSQEIALIEKFKSSENLDYLSQLYAPYMGLVYGVCLKYLRNKDQAKDAVMDIFEKLIIELKKHDTPKVFKTWLYVVAKNFCLMQLRHDDSENKAFKKMSTEFMENDFDMHPIDKEHETDQSPALRKCMEQLKEQQRNAIELFYYKKLCYREIAEQLNIPEKNIKSDIQNGKRNLKICIENSNK